MICKAYYLGGIRQEGSTCLVLEFEKNLLLFNFGRDVVPDDLLGISRQVPDFTQIIKKIEAGYTILGLFINSFSTKYIGGIPNLIKEIPNIPIYCSSVTGKIVQKYIQLKAGVRNTNINVIESNKVLGMAPSNKGNSWEIKQLKAKSINSNLTDEEGKQYFSLVLPFNTLSRAVGSMGFYVRLFDQVFCVSGEFIFGPKFSENSYNDINALTQVTNYPVLMLTCDGKNAYNHDYTYPKNLITKKVSDLINNNTKTIVAAIDIEESTMLIEIINIAKKLKRNVILCGKSLQYHYNVYKENGDIKLNNEFKVIYDDNAKHDDYKKAIVVYSDTFERLVEKVYDELCQGLDAEWKNNVDLTLICVQYLPLWEVPLQKLISELSKTIDNIKLLTSKGFVSANASFFDLTMLQDIVRFKVGYLALENADDKTIINAYKKLSEFNMIKPLNIDNFEVLTFEKNMLKTKREKLDRARSQTFTLVGNHKIGSRVLRKRRNLSSEGVAMISILKTNKKEGTNLKIQFKSAGLFSTESMSDKIKIDMEKSLRKVIEDSNQVNTNMLEENIRAKAKSIIKKATKKLPEIIIHFHN